MRRLLRADLNKLVYDRRIWFLLVAVVLIPCVLFGASALFPQNDAADRAGDYRLLRSRIQSEMELQADEAVRREYLDQYELVAEMEASAALGQKERELSLQIELERRNVSGGNLVFYEDVFSRYLGLSQQESIENRISYRAYLMENGLDLARRDEARYSAVYIIYTCLPTLMPLAVLAICMAVTQLFVHEAAAGTVKVLLAAPYRRWKIALSKCLTSLLAANALAFLFVLTLLLPLCLHGLTPNMEYPIHISVSTGASFRIGDASFLTAGGFLKLYLLMLPLNVLFYLSLFNLLSFCFSSSAPTKLLFVLLAAFSVLSANTALPLAHYMPFYYANTFLVLTGAPLIERIPLLAALLFFAGGITVFLGVRVFQKRDLF